MNSPHKVVNPKPAPEFDTEMYLRAIKGNTINENLRYMLDEEDLMLTSREKKTMFELT